MAQSVRAILLASAIAASFFGLRASRLSNQGDARPGLAKRITAVAPSTTSLHRASLRTYRQPTEIERVGGKQPFRGHQLGTESDL